jgi:hypothetical protein
VVEVSGHTSYRRPFYGVGFGLYVFLCQAEVLALQVYHCLVIRGTESWLVLGRYRASADPSYPEGVAVVVELFQQRRSAG